METEELSLYHKLLESLDKSTVIIIYNKLITHIYMEKGESENEALRKMDESDFYYVAIFCGNLSEGGS